MTATNNDTSDHACRAGSREQEAGTCESYAGFCRGGPGQAESHSQVPCSREGGGHHSQHTWSVRPSGMGAA